MGESNGDSEKKADNNSANNEKKVDLGSFLGSNNNNISIIPILIVFYLKLSVCILKLNVMCFILFILVCLSYIYVVMM
jgi:Ca2+/Na+ antiporter